MSTSIPPIKKYMTAEVQTIGDQQPMSVAHRLMKEQRIRHLPVLHQGELVGLVGDRDLRLVEELKHADPTRVTVREVMARQPYVVGPDAELDEVVATMAAKQHSAAVVSNNGKVVGIFTTVDACRTLAEVLTTWLSRDSRKD
jgi:acetoin utilization protein AcuB